MAINDPTPGGQLRQPRGIVQVRAGTGGTPISAEGWLTWSVTNNSYYEADTFHVEFAASELPNEVDPDWFSQQTEVFVEIFAGFPADPTAPTVSELDSLIFARVDEIEYDPVSTTLTLTGRDLTGVFIDSKIASQYVNKTSSQIAKLLAGTHGIATNITTTTAKVGTFYQIDQQLLQANQSEWDLLCYLARNEGFVVFVTGQTLYFGPDPRESADPWTLQWSIADDGQPSANVDTVSFTRDMTVSKGLAVTVISTSLTGPAVKQSFPTAPKGIAAGKASPYGPVQTYFFHLAPGHDAVACEQFAEKMYHQIASHAMKVKGSAPADNLLSVQVPMKVVGTETDWDQGYFVTLVTREMSLEEGYHMTFDAQNITPQLEQAAQATSDPEADSTAL